MLATDTANAIHNNMARNANALAAHAVDNIPRTLDNITARYAGGSAEPRAVLRVLAFGTANGLFIVTPATETTSASWRLPLNGATA